MRRLRRISLILTLALSTVVVGATASAAQDADAPSIAEVATEDGRFTTLVAALDAAGLVETFADCEGEGVFTVLAPTDDAFVATLGELGLDPADVLADTDLLTSILTYHVVEGAATSDIVATLDGASAPTLQGEEISVVVDGESIMIENGNPAAATVIVADVLACNGVIHAIDNVLIPPTVAAAVAGAPAEDAAAEDPPAEETVEEAAPETLPETGAEQTALAFIAVGLLVIGMASVGTSRRLRSLS